MQIGLKLCGLGIAVAALLTPAQAFATSYFGTFTQGGSSDNLNTNQQLCTNLTTPADIGPLSSMSIYVNTAETNGTQWKLLIDDTSGNFVAASTAFTPSSTGWATSTISATLTKSTQYCFGVIYQTGGSAAGGQYAFTASGASNVATGNYTTPGNVTFSSVPNYGMSIYAAYTPASTASTPPPNWSITWW